MFAPRRIILVLGLGVALLVLSGFTSWRAVTTDHPREGEAIHHHIQLLKFGKAQQKAAAACWLGQQRSAAASRLIIWSLCWAMPVKWTLRCTGPTRR